MPTILEFDPAKVEEVKAGVTARPKNTEGLKMPLRLPSRGPQPEFFASVLVESDSPERRRRGMATTVSFIMECVALGFLLIIPLMFTEALPTPQLLTFLAAPPPPPPPAPPVPPVTRVVQTDMLNNGQLRTPTRIPKKVEIVREEEAPPPAMAGVVGGVPGGVPGGQLGGVIGGIISSSQNSLAAVPKLETQKRVRISQGVTQGLVVTKTAPVYPSIALAARITGVVLLKAIIGKDGRIEQLQALSGHPLLIRAAIDAVQQWRFRPYLLNGEPVEVETTVAVTFAIQS